MSTAERIATQFYQTHHIYDMPEDVRHYLVVLIQKSGEKKGRSLENNTDPELALPIYEEGELEGRCMKAYEESGKGMSKPIDDFFDEAEKKYPWLTD